jgi:HD superfamily phosphohydrolase
MDVVDHPLFQRLRSIKQNGLLYLVFPGATHTRFEHSLGALYVAHGMVGSLMLNSVVGRAKHHVKERMAAQQGEAIEFPPSPEDLDRQFVTRITRLAALAHDLGHGPMSHTFDSFAPTREKLTKILDSPSLAALKPLRDFLLKWGTDDSKSSEDVKNARVPHEIMSCLFFCQIWTEIKRNEDTADKGDETPVIVAAAILGKHNDARAVDTLAWKSEYAWLPLVHDIVASAPADADRMDYMERDSRSMGVTYGLFDRNRVLKSLLCYRELDESSSHVEYRLGVKRSGLQAIENLMQARYELFAQIYYHKTNRAISLMLESISREGGKQIDLFKECETMDQIAERYLNLSDEHFVRILQGKEAIAVSDSIAETMRDILQRRLWKRILEPVGRIEADEIVSSLREKFSVAGTKIQVDETKPRALKDLSQGAALLLRNPEGVYVAGRIGPWTDESTIIKALKAADARVFRIYYMDSSDKGLASQIRNEALKLVFQKAEGLSGPH